MKLKVGERYTIIIPFSLNANTYINKTGGPTVNVGTEIIIRQIKEPSIVPYGFNIMVNGEWFGNNSNTDGLFWKVMDIEELVVHVPTVGNTYIVREEFAAVSEHVGNEFTLLVNRVIEVTNYCDKHGRHVAKILNDAGPNVYISHVEPEKLEPFGEYNNQITPNTHVGLTYDNLLALHRELSVPITTIDSVSVKEVNVDTELITNGNFDDTSRTGSHDVVFMGMDFDTMSDDIENEEDK